MLSSAPATHHTRPELLSPAGNWECARAAVANGADAIFFGMPRFNARLRADNFTEEDLPALMTFLHQHGVKGYCAFNTLVFTSELPDAAAQLKLLEDAGVDAVIVQDLGLARMVKELAPNLRLHASTQMTITSPEGLEFAKKLDIDQAVLARELSLRELERFKDSAVPLETFVHGALCVAYSGQCLTSESLGKRSANRGECAQACRMPYEMIVDGQKIDLGDKAYLLSPQDLAAVHEIPKLIELGIKSFKIEGRLKTPEYVAAVTQAYRKAIDAALANRPDPINDADMYAMEMTFSRGLYTGWMHGVNHQELVGARYGKKRGPYVGKVVGVIDNDTVKLDELHIAMKPGDGVVFENTFNTNDEQGGSVYEMDGTVLSFRHGLLNMDFIPNGTRVYKTSAPALNRALRQTFENDIPLRKQHQLDLIVTGRVGEPLHVSCRGVTVESTMPLQVALKRPLSVETIRDQFGRLGGTTLELGEVKFDVEGEVIVPVSELNRMRRDLISDSRFLIPDSGPLAKESSTSLERMLVDARGSLNQESKIKNQELSVLCRTFDHIDIALNHAVQRLYIDFEDIRKYNEAVQHIRKHEHKAEIFLATPRIQKSGEAGFFKLIERSAPDGVLIRNLGALSFFEGTGLRVTGDFSLNVANPLTAHFLKTNTALEQLTISYDLNIEQVLDLLRAAPPEWFEITLHQHMPMFHMEHCAFAAFMSKGTDFTNCGRPCEKHRVHLRDRIGMDHPLKADVGCRNTLFNARAQTGASFFPQLVEAGLHRFRIELLEENRDDTAHTLRQYQQLLAGKNDGQTLWRELRAQSQLGVTKGTLGE